MRRREPCAADRSSDLDEMGERFFRQKIESKIYPEMRDLVRAHMERGHTVC